MVTGVSDAEFQPDRNITVEGAAEPTFTDPVSRQEMAVMIVRALGLADQAELVSGMKLDFRDADEIAPWANGAVVTAVFQELLQGMGDDTLQPGGRATRAQAAVLVLRAMQRQGLILRQN